VRLQRSVTGAFGPMRSTAMRLNGLSINGIHPKGTFDGRSALSETIGMVSLSTVPRHGAVFR